VSGFGSKSSGMAKSIFESTASIVRDNIAVTMRATSPVDTFVRNYVILGLMLDIKDSMYVTKRGKQSDKFAPFGVAYI